MTPQEKAAETRKQRNKQRDDEFHARLDDRKVNIAILRKIRDDPTSAPSDRIAAIRLIVELF